MPAPSNERIVRSICEYYDDPKAAFEIIMEQLKAANPVVTNGRGKIRSKFVNKEKELLHRRNNRKGAISRLSERIK